MTSFIHVEQPLQHPGVARAEAAIEHWRVARKRFDGARGLAALLLGAVIAAMLVVADRLVVYMADGGLLAGWVVLWALAFVALALLADRTRSLARRTIALWQRGVQRRALARADAQFLAGAQSDPRVMQELKAAQTRQQALQLDAAPSAAPAADPLKTDPSVRIPSLYEATRRVRTAWYY